MKKYLIYLMLFFSIFIGINKTHAASTFDKEVKVNINHIKNAVIKNEEEYLNIVNKNNNNIEVYNLYNTLDLDLSDKNYVITYNGSYRIYYWDKDTSREDNINFVYTYSNYYEHIELRAFLNKITKSSEANFTIHCISVEYLNNGPTIRYDYYSYSAFLELTYSRHSYNPANTEYSVSTKIYKTNLPIKYSSFNYSSIGSNYKLTNFSFFNDKETYKMEEGLLLYDENLNLVLENIKFSFQKYKEVSDTFDNIQLIGFHIIIKNFNENLLYEYGFNNINEDGTTFNPNINDVSNWTSPESIKYDETNDYYYFDVNVENNGTLFVRAFELDENNNAIVKADNKINILSISKIRNIKLDITNTEGIILIPKASENSFSTDINFSIPDEYLDYYNRNNNIRFKFSVKSEHLYDVNDFMINDLYNQEPEYFEFETEYGFSEIVRPNNYNITLIRPESPKYLGETISDRPLIIIFDSNVYNYQILNNENSENLSIIDPNTGNEIKLDSINNNNNFFDYIERIFKNNNIKEIFKNLYNTFRHGKIGTYFFIVIISSIIILLIKSLSR